MTGDWTCPSGWENVLSTGGNQFVSLVFAMAVKRNLSCFFSKGIGWTGQWYESGWGSGTRGVFLLLLPRWSTMFSYEKTGDLLKLLKDCKK